MHLGVECDDWWKQNDGNNKLAIGKVRAILAAIMYYSTSVLPIHSIHFWMLSNNSIFICGMIFGIDGNGIAAFFYRN